MECKLQIGKWAVCVDDNDQGQKVVLQAGNKYLITNMQPDFDTIFVSFEGDPYGPNASWFHFRFKPMDDLNTDISAFTKMLLPTPPKTKIKQKEKEDA